MGADKVLVEGAYAAAGGGIDRSEGFSALSAAGKRVGEELSKDIEKKSKEFKDYMDWELNKNPGLNPEERKQLAEELQKKRMQYITGDGEQRSMMMSDLANDKHQ